MNDNDLPQDAIDEAHKNNRLNGLPAKAPTELRRKQPDGTVLTFTSTSPEGAKAWVDDMIEALGLMQFAAEIDSWEADNDRSLNILNTYFHAEYMRINDAMWDRREEVSTLRW